LTLSETILRSERTVKRADFAYLQPTQSSGDRASATDAAFEFGIGFDLAIDFDAIDDECAAVCPRKSISA
jgi:hypothetical protein